MESYAKSLSELAKAGAAVAKERGILGQCGKMCDTCAFRWDQEHILSYFLAADEAARRMISGEDNFYCHTWDFKCADKPCAGYQFAKLVYKP